MPSSRLKRAVLLAAVWAAFGAVAWLVSGSVDIRFLLLAVVPVAVTGWLYGVIAGSVAGALLLAWAWWLPLPAGMLRPNLDQSLLLAFASLAGPLLGVMAVFKNRDDRHRRASSAARFDPLTGLYTRANFSEELGVLLDEARREGTLLAVLFVDLDRFKVINDTFGHDAGDTVLRRISQRLRDNAESREIVGRFAGDEFVVAMPNVRDTEFLASRARRLLSALGKPVDLGGKSVGVGASIGISVFPTDGDSIDALIKFADRAMYHVKSGGKNYFSFSTDDMRRQRNRQLEVERQLRQAMESHDEFRVLYQPQFDLKSGRIVGFEALLRWTNRELGAVSPEEFIPITEDSGAIVQLGHWMMREVCQQAATWRRAGLPPVRIAVNVSPLQFTHPEFVSHVKQALRDGGMLPNSLELEITEGLLLGDTETVVRTLQRLRRLEVRTVLDDFGTGYSSLSYLERLPIASLKIPQTFVSGVGGTLGRRGRDRASERSTVIVEAICALAHKLSKVVIAEGIETEAQRSFLRQIGCDIGQGFLMSGPLGVNEAEELQLRSLGPAPQPVAARSVGNAGVEGLLISD